MTWRRFNFGVLADAVSFRVAVDVDRSALTGANLLPAPSAPNQGVRYSTAKSHTIAPRATWGIVAAWKQRARRWSRHEQGSDCGPHLQAGHGSPMFFVTQTYVTHLPATRTKAECARKLTTGSQPSSNFESTVGARGALILRRWLTAFG